MGIDRIIKNNRRLAETLARDSIGSDGIWASPTMVGFRWGNWMRNLAAGNIDGFFEGPAVMGYRYQNWTRDTANAGIDAAVYAGREDIAKRQLEMLRNSQRADGSIETMIKDNAYKWAFQRTLDLALHPFSKTGPYAARLLLKIRGGTPVPDYDKPADAELQYISAVNRFAELTGNPGFLAEYSASMERALDSALGRKFKDGLFRGLDWRDNAVYPEDVALLSNNVLLVHAYDVLKRRDQAATLRDRIHQEFWNDGYHTDRPVSDYSEGDNFDAFGQALAILWGVPSKEFYRGREGGSVANKFASLICEYGFMANDLAVPENCTPEQRRKIDKVNQYSKDWGFVTGCAIIALNEMGKKDLAIHLFHHWSRTYSSDEWTDPVTGQRGGSLRQMWNGPLYLRAGKALGVFK